MSYYDNELQNGLNRNKINFLISKTSTDEYFEKVKENFPVSGTQIDWPKVSRYYKKLINDTVSNNFNQCIDFVTQKFLKKIDTKIIYIGDSLTECTYLLGFDAIKRFFPITAINIPQHHYFIDSEATWCIAVNMENDFDFGYSKFS